MNWKLLVWVSWSIAGSLAKDTYNEEKPDKYCKYADKAKLTGLELNLDGRCYMKAAIGDCRAAIPMYEFNFTTRECQKRLYGGCKGCVPFSELNICTKLCRDPLPKILKPLEAVVSVLKDPFPDPESLLEPEEDINPFGDDSFPNDTDDPKKLLEEDESSSYKRPPPYEGTLRKIEASDSFSSDSESSNKNSTHLKPLPKTRGDFSNEKGLDKKS